MNDIIRLRDVECRDCYKCIRNCPVKAIRYSDGRAEIVTHECILCGECVVTCPQRGDFVFSQVDEIRKLIVGGPPRGGEHRAVLRCRICRSAPSKACALRCRQMGFY